MIPVNQKTLDKWRKEEVELHKKVILSYLYQIGLKLNTRNKLMALYSHYVDYSNILDFIHLPCRVFINALVKDELDQVKSYIVSTRIHPIKLKHSRKKQHD